MTEVSYCAGDTIFHIYGSKPNSGEWPQICDDYTYDSKAFLSIKVNLNSTSKEKAFFRFLMPHNVCF